MVTQAIAGLRSLNHRTDACRDLDVTIALLRDRGLSALARDFSKRRLEQRAELRRRLRDASDFGDELAALSQRGGVSERKAIGRAAAIAAKCERVFERRLRALRVRFDVEALHAVRRKARRLRDVGRVTLELGSSRESRKKDLTELQRELGSIHDLAVLAQVLTKVGQHEHANAVRAQAKERYLAWFRGKRANGSQR